MQQQQANMAAGKTDGGPQQQQLQQQQKQLEAAQAEAKRAQSETERLLQLMQMSQEEQSAKDKTIRDLQEYSRTFSFDTSVTPLVRYPLQ